MKSHLQFTLRELLFVVAFVGLGLAALAKGGAVGAIVVSLAMAFTKGLASSRLPAGVQGKLSRLGS